MIPDHNYVAKIREFIAKNKIPIGRVGDIGVFHDDWCGLYHGHRCDCNPVVRLLKTHPAPKDSQR